MKTVKIGILGLGTVGGGTYQILDMNKELIEKRIGREIKVVRVLEKNMDRLKTWACRSPARHRILTIF